MSQTFHVNIVWMETSYDTDYEIIKIQRDRAKEHEFALAEVSKTSKYGIKIAFIAMWRIHFAEIAGRKRE